VLTHIALGPSNVCCWENSGKHLLAASISPFDPNRSRTSLPTTDRLRGPRCWLTASGRYDMLMLLVEENGVMACAQLRGETGTATQINEKSG
jgi:hypothetical protein